ncbi:MAG: fatty acid desaturase [Nocardioides sp.]|uniref:fatty acid desaturase family protein n=1 Tax=Nocardioides sp. TaxID=35761 RepID=UPI00238D2DD5|nr:fatty acid desaturase [Nocardioides sp.]MDE0777044.1 fatty acid desaturase [Nocardioides sp.]
MKVWKNSPKDAILAGISVVQLIVTVGSPIIWSQLSTTARAVDGVLLTMLMAYNIIVVSHLFTHMPWFVSARLNAVTSVVNSISIGQSVQAYQFTHVRNHHRYNNDRQRPDGETRDRSSTYRRGKNGQHEPLLSYILGGALSSVVGRAVELSMVVRGWRVTDANLLRLASRQPGRRSRELRQVRLDRAAHCLALVALATISWQWALFCYLPAFVCALVLVNVQNYFRHYGADPDSRTTDSVSHYGRLYNLLTFNDGYHQEHHLSPATHWSQMPAVHARHRERLATKPRIISPVPAMVGFLDRSRPLLHEGTSESSNS